jgi:hypothetical protein
MHARISACVCTPAAQTAPAPASAAIATAATTRVACRFFDMLLLLVAWSD